MSTAAPPRRGRPPLVWLTADELAGLPAGTALTVETYGKHTPRTVGRLVNVVDDTLHLEGPSGSLEIPARRVKRARVVDAIFEPGDPVVLRGVSEARWRGGVVRTNGTDVLVEQIGGDFAWHAESSLEPAEARARTG